MFANMFTFLLSFHTVGTNQVIPTPVCISPCLSFIFCPILSGIAFVFGPAVPQQFVVVLKYHQMTDGRLSKYSLCPTFSILGLSLVTVASLPAIDGETWWLSLPEYTVTLYPGLLHITQYNTACNFYMKPLYFFSKCCLKMTLPVQSTII